MSLSYNFEMGFVLRDKNGNKIKDQETGQEKKRAGRGMDFKYKLNYFPNRIIYFFNSTH